MNQNMITKTLSSCKVDIRIGHRATCENKSFGRNSIVLPEILASIPTYKKSPQSQRKPIYHSVLAKISRYECSSSQRDGTKELFDESRKNSNSDVYEMSSCRTEGLCDGMLMLHAELARQNDRRPDIIREHVWCNM